MVIPSTIKEDIEQGKKAVLGHRTFNIAAKLHYVNSDETILIPFEHIASKYKDFFDSQTVSVAMSLDEERLYRFNPKRLSLDLYQNIGYWSILLFINDCHSVIDFEPHGSIKVINPNRIKDLVNEILLLEGII